MSVSVESQLDALLSRRARVPMPPSRVAVPAGAIKYEFGGGRPDPESFPLAELIRATETALWTDGRQALTYGTFQGYEGLRDVVVEKTRLFEGFTIGRENLLIANGSSHAMAIICDTFVDVGDTIVCEAPCFSGSLGTFRRSGAELVGVPLDDQGMRTDVLADTLAALAAGGRRPKFIYTIINFQNPAGPSLPLHRRRELLELAERYDTLIVEDDAYGELRFEGEPITSLYVLDQSGRVLRTGTLSKILAAGVRLGWVLAARPLIDRLMRLKLDGGTNPFVSRVAAQYLRDHLEEHVLDLRRIYQGKRDAMLEALDQHLGGTGATWSRPQGGFFIWLTLPADVDPAKLQAEAVKRGVGTVAGPAFFPDGRDGVQNVRFAFSYAGLEAIRAGIAEFAAAFHSAR